MRDRRGSSPLASIAAPAPTTLWRHQQTNPLSANTDSINSKKLQIHAMQISLTSSLRLLIQSNVFKCDVANEINRRNSWHRFISLIELFFQIMQISLTSSTANQIEFIQMRRCHNKQQNRPNMQMRVDRIHAGLSYSMVW